LLILDSLSESVSLQQGATIAIVGAGPAGMTLARELSHLGDLIVVESGGFEDTPKQQDLMMGECAGVAYPLTETRARHFGGSSALWAGYCAIFDPHDFQRRDWVPSSGWPFGVEALQPYYMQVARTLNVDAPDFDARAIAERSGHSLPLHNEMLSPTVWRFGQPTQRFGESFRTEFELDSKIKTLINANVVDIELDGEHRAVRSLVIRTLTGRTGRITADIFVLACGGIEIPRLLLNATSQMSCGVANSGDMVGRCFMEHPHRSITPLVLTNSDAVENWTRRCTFEGSKEFMSCIGLSAQAQQDAQIMNARAHIYRTPSMLADETPRVGLFMEQAPNRNSRVRVVDRRDALGMRRASLDWQFTELDTKTYEGTALLLAGEFERSGIARLSGPVEDTRRDRDPIMHSNHHLGTTRMSKTNADGVVDSDCRAHDHENLYIIGGSVFPTVSWANPTFTVMALTYRLADHLRSRVAPRESTEEWSSELPV
jgi:choline dehydrogenase-like flavoprotein